MKAKFLFIFPFLSLLTGCTWLSQEKHIPEPTAIIQEKDSEQTIYALGDSLTAGYQLPLEDAYPAQLETILQKKGYDIQVVNAGKSGDTSAGLLARVERLTEEAQANDIALIVIGANDGMQSLPLEELENNIRNIIVFLQEKKMNVVLGGMQIPTNFDPIYRKEFTELYSKIGSSYDIRIIPFFLEDVATIRSLNLPDGIHPNKAGYEIISSNVAEFLISQNIIE